eukprot:2306286-Rhodomonas_salina.2
MSRRGPTVGRYVNTGHRVARAEDDSGRATTGAGALAGGACHRARGSTLSLVVPYAHVSTANIAEDGVYGRLRRHEEGLYEHRRIRRRVHSRLGQAGTWAESVPLARPMLSAVSLTDHVTCSREARRAEDQAARQVREAGRG